MAPAPPPPPPFMAPPPPPPPPPPRIPPPPPSRCAITMVPSALLAGAVCAAMGVSSMMLAAKPVNASLCISVS
ncbi:MAG: hypothetical protein C0519_13140 [Hyphomicrobium sp.]|nr:hypothetical protein [Hyphomicrobium sp.]